MLTPEQHEARSRGIGGSDVAALLGVSGPGGKSMVDVWVRKRRGPNLELDPIVTDWDADDDKPSSAAPFIQGKATDAGTVLEDAIASLYTMISGLEVARCRSLIGRQPWHRANLDRVTGPNLASRRMIQAKHPIWANYGVDRGLEIKLVGYWASQSWPDEGLPDYVRLQCQWYMAVTGLHRWDVAALIAGTDPRIVRVQRDEGVIMALEEVVDMFWTKYVLGNTTPPAPDSGKAAMDLVRAVLPEEELEEVETDSEDMLAIMAELVRQRAARKAAEKKIDKLNATGAALCGRHAGLHNPQWGSFKFKMKRGAVDWKGVAHELAGGVFDDELLERHRRASTRVAQGYPRKAWSDKILEAATGAELATG